MHYPPVTGISLPPSAQTLVARLILLTAAGRRGCLSKSALCGGGEEKSGSFQYATTMHTRTRRANATVTNEVPHAVDWSGVADLHRIRECLCVPGHLPPMPSKRDQIPRSHLLLLCAVTQVQSTLPPTFPLLVVLPIRHSLLPTSPVKKDTKRRRRAHLVDTR